MNEHWSIANRLNRFSTRKNKLNIIEAKIYVLKALYFFTFTYIYTALK